MDELEVAPLYVAATRPAMLLGVPLPLASMIFMAAMMIGVLRFWGPLVGLPLWFLASVLVRRDYNAPGILFLRWNASRLSLEAGEWGGASKAPFPARLPKRFRGIAP